MDLDQPGTTTKQVKFISVAYVPGLSRNLLSTRTSVGQWGKPLVYYKPKAVLGFPREEPLVVNFFPRKGLFSAIGLKRTPSQEASVRLAAKTAEAMKIEATGQWGPCADVRLSLRQGAALAAAKAHDMVAVHRLLAHPSEEMTQKTVQSMGIATTGQWGPFEAPLQMKVKQKAVQWIDEPDKICSNGASDRDLDVKPGEDESIGKTGLHSST